MVIDMYYRRLKDLREDKDLVQKEVAAYLGIDQRVYSNYETGKREPSLELLVAMSRYFNVSINYLITGEEFEKR